MSYFHLPFLSSFFNLMFLLMYFKFCFAVFLSSLSLTLPFLLSLSIRLHPRLFCFSIPSPSSQVSFPFIALLTARLSLLISNSVPPFLTSSIFSFALWFVVLFLLSFSLPPFLFWLVRSLFPISFYPYFVGYLFLPISIFIPSFSCLTSSFYFSFVFIVIFLSLVPSTFLSFIF